MEISGVNPERPIVVAPAEKMVIALGIAGMAVGLGVGSGLILAIACVCTVVCLVLMVFRGDRSRRRSAMKLYPNEAWAEYGLVRGKDAALSIVIFAAILVAGLAVNAFLENGSQLQFLAALVVGCCAVVGVFNLPTFKRLELR